jgi:Homeodomain-like domain
MARAIAVPLRLALFRCWQRGQTVAEISEALALPPRTVRQLVQRFRDGQRGDVLAPAYDRCGWHRSWRDPEVQQLALELRRQHARWGAGLIRVLLRERWPKQPLPSTRTLQRWFANAGLGPAPRGRPPATQRQRANQPHEVWQMDAVEQLHLRQGGQACWLRITDEFTGAVLHTKVFPVARWSEVEKSATQVELRKAFTRWGRPERLRVDNGTPWGSKGDLPTVLALWIVGLDVALTWNPPRQPKENAVVERSQGVSQQWAEPQTCATAAELQQRLDRMDRIQREAYPSIQGASRTQKYPELAHSGRDYTPEWETRQWSLNRVLQCLAEYAVPRRVDQKGEIWLYDRSYWVGRSWIGQVIYVTVDPQTSEWVYQDRHGGVIRRQAAEHLTREGITGMEFGKSRHRPPRGKTSRRN